MHCGGFALPQQMRGSRQGKIEGVFMVNKILGLLSLDHVLEGGGERHNLRILIQSYLLYLL